MGGAQLVPRLLQPRLVLGDQQLDRAQAPHPGEWAAKRAKRRVRAGTEVPQPSPKRLAGEGALEEIGLERLAFGAVARRLRPRHALAHNRFSLTPFHRG